MKEVLNCDLKISFAVYSPEGTEDNGADKHTDERLSEAVLGEKETSPQVVTEPIIQSAMEMFNGRIIKRP